VGSKMTAGGNITPSFLNQYYGTADAAASAVTVAAQTTLTTPATVPANEPAAGSAYELLFGGSFTWSTSTPQLLAFTITLAGTVILNGHPGILATAFAASAAGRFTGRATLTYSATGAGGAVFADYFINLSETANAANPGTAANNTVGISDCNSAAQTIDTTASMSWIVKCGWAGIVGTPTITNRHTCFRKIA